MRTSRKRLRTPAWARTIADSAILQAERSHWAQHRAGPHTGYHDVTPRTVIRVLPRDLHLHAGRDGSWACMVPDPPDHRRFIARQNREAGIAGAVIEWS